MISRSGRSQSAETADYGILRCIVNDPELAFNLLKENNILVGKTEVMAIEMVDRPGGMHVIASILGDARVNIEYFYAFATQEKGVLILQVSRGYVEQAQSILSENGIHEYSPEEIYLI